MPLYGDKNRRNFGERKAPTTKAEYRESIISYMKHSGELAQRSERVPPNNPDRLPEMSMYKSKGMPKRQWTVAQEMVAEGVAKIANGSFESGSVYLVAGEKWDG
jgi:hypothetical protein